MVVGNRMAFFSDAMALRLRGHRGRTADACPGRRAGIGRVPLAGAADHGGFWALVGLDIAFVKENTGIASDTVIGVFSPERSASTPCCCPH